MDSEAIRKKMKEELITRVLFRFWGNQKALLIVASVNFISLMIILKDNFSANGKWPFFSGVGLITVLILINIYSMNQAWTEIEKLESLENK